MQNLQWVKSIDAKWFNLAKLDLTHIHTTGVYIIWHGGSNPRIVRVGHGNIASRLTAHRMNHQIMRFGDYGPVMVTWADLPDLNRREGVTRYLTEEFLPLIKDRVPEVAPILASSPFV